MDCRVCGRQFEPMGFQVMVPGLQHGFDRVDCALEASALELPGTRSLEPTPAVVPVLAPSVAPLPALAVGALPATTTVSARPHFLGGANLALLAAGTAARARRAASASRRMRTIVRSRTPKSSREMGPAGKLSERGSFAPGPPYPGAAGQPCDSARGRQPWRAFSTKRRRS